MKKVLFIASLLLAFTVQTDAKPKKALTEKDMGAYLFTYFNDPTHSLFMAISYDDAPRLMGKLGKILAVMPQHQRRHILGEMLKTQVVEMRHRRHLRTQTQIAIGRIEQIWLQFAQKTCDRQFKITYI